MDQNKSSIENRETEETDALDEVLDNAPPEAKAALKAMMIQSHQIRMETSPATKLMEKITPEHITSFMNTNDEQMRRSFMDRNFQRIFLIVLVALGILAVILIIESLKDSQQDLLENVLYAGGGFVSGIIGGFGYGKTKRDDQDSLKPVCPQKSCPRNTDIHGMRE